MSGKRFRTRAKTVQKLGRDGLVEQNLSTGEKKRISQRTADVSFGPDRTKEPALELRAIRRGGGNTAAPVKKKRRKQSRPIQHEKEAAEQAISLEAEDLPSMPAQADTPIADTPASGEEEISLSPAPKRRQKRKTRQKTMQAEKETPDIVADSSKEPSADTPMADMPASSEEEISPPLAPKRHQKRRNIQKSTQTEKETPDIADSLDESPSDSDLQRDGKLRFSPEEPTAEPSDSKQPHRQQKSFKKAEQRLTQAEHKLEKVREKLPMKRCIAVERQYDGETGRLRRRLRFEREVLPEYRKPSLPARAGDLAKTTAVMQLHRKIRESARDNVAVEASHKGELFAEQGVGRMLRWNRNRLRSQSHRMVRRAERRLIEARTALAWQTALRDNPELRRKNLLSKWMQKRRIQRRHAQTAYETWQAAALTQNTLTAGGQITRAAAQFVAARKSLLAAAALLAVVMLFFSAGMTACTAMLSGVQSAYVSASYTADEQDICDADLYYTELETDLQIVIHATETDYPDYDEYRYTLGEIGHDPYALMAYLSAAYDGFTFAQVRGELERLFREQYTLTREAVEETLYDSNGMPYDGTILQTTLTVKPLADIISASLAPGEQTDRYSVYLQTLGNRQAFGNPFDFPWLAYVSSDYGYRVHPITQTRSLHRGLDIAAVQGTAIHAVQDGEVVSAGDAGGYGLCVVIRDDNGYLSRYAHCSSLAVSAGQEVKRGDVIAAVGSTGNSTGPHLHLEVMWNGEYLNPYYFVDTGGG